MSRTCPNCTPVRGSEALWVVLPSHVKIGQKEVASTEEVANMITLCKCHGNITRGCLVIAVNTFGTDDSIEGFKGVSCEKHGWSKTMDVFWQVKYNVEFGFGEPCTSPTGGHKKKILDFGLYGGLKTKNVKKQYSIPSTMNSLNRH